VHKQFNITWKKKALQSAHITWSKCFCQADSQRTGCIEHIVSSTKETKILYSWAGYEFSYSTIHDIHYIAFSSNVSVLVIENLADWEPNNMFESHTTAVILHDHSQSFLRVPFNQICTCRSHLFYVFYLQHLRRWIEELLLTCLIQTPRIGHLTLNDTSLMKGALKKDCERSCEEDINAVLLSSSLKLKPLGAHSGDLQEERLMVFGPEIHAIHRLTIVYDTRKQGVSDNTWIAHHFLTKLLVLWII